MSDVTSKDVRSELRRLEKRVEDGGHYGFEQSIWMRAADEIDRLAARVAELEKDVERYRQYEHIEAYHDGFGHVWTGPRYKIPLGYVEISNESGVLGAALGERT